MSFSHLETMRNSEWDRWWEVAPGIWLSSFCLLPLGLLFTYKAAKDSPVFNSEAYIIFWGKVKNLFNKIKNRKKLAEENRAADSQEKI